MKPIDWWSRKIARFERWLYHDVCKFAEGQLLPKWIRPVRYLLHPLWLIEKTHRIRRDMSRDIIYIYGVPISGHMLHMLTGKFDCPTIAHKIDGRIVYTEIRPGEIFYVNEKGEISTDIL